MSMSILALSLKRLYENGKIKIEKVDSIRENGKITQDEYSYITGTTNANA